MVFGFILQTFQEVEFICRSLENMKTNEFEINLYIVTSFS